MPIRKKYNPLKQLNLVARASLKDKAIGCVVGRSSGCQLIDLKKNKKIPVTENMALLISDLPHKWSVFIAVFGIDEFDKRYMKSEEIFVKDPIKQADLAETLNNHHRKLAKNFNPNHLFSYGWLATPYPKDWDEQKAFKLLENLGAFRFKKVAPGELVEIA